MSNHIIRLSAAEYHADTIRISKHGLDLIHRAPALYDHARRNPRTKQTPAQRIGDLVDLAVLDPERFAAEVTAKPDGLDRRTKAGKEAWEALETQFRYVLSADELEYVHGMAQAARWASKGLFFESRNQVTVHWQRDGALCRSRIDAVKGDVVVDLKTCADITAFQRDAIRFRYHVQAAFYLDALRSCLEPADRFAFVVVEKEAPFLSTVFWCDDAFIDAGREQYLRDLATYIECRDADLWPGLPEEQTLTVPTWYYAR